MDEIDRLAALFEDHRTHLKAVAYRMLGSLGEAEDAVQETWLRLSRSDASAIDNLGGWLTTVVSRICLDLLRSRAARPEADALPWMPDPLLAPAAGPDPEQEALLAGEIGLALQVVLEQLAPPERIAYVLHDVFAVPFEQVAEIVDRSPAATSSARQPRPPPRAGRGALARPRPRRPARGRRRLLRRLPARATSTRSSPCSTPTSSCAPPTCAGPA